MAFIDKMWCERYSCPRVRCAYHLARRKSDDGDCPAYLFDFLGKKDDVCLEVKEDTQKAVKRQKKSGDDLGKRIKNNKKQKRVTPSKWQQRFGGKI